MPAIRIESLPPGDAPPHIRQAWVGVVLQLADLGVAQPAICTSNSVLPQRRTFWSTLLSKFSHEVEEQPAPGYIVDASAAVGTLEQVNPSAAAWWRTHAPHMLQAGKRFVFSVTCCAELSDEQA